MANKSTVQPCFVLQQYVPTGKYDSVMVLGHMGTAPTPSYWGLSWIGPIMPTPRRWMPLT